MSEVVDVPDMEEELEFNLGVQSILLFLGRLGIMGLRKRREQWGNNLVIETSDKLLSKV